MAKRKHGKIDKLPETLRENVEQMMLSDFTYAEIADHIKSHGYEISLGSVYRHAKNLNTSVRELRMAQENFRVIMEEVAKYPALDTTEGIIRLLSNNLLQTINQMPEDKWKEMNPEEILKQSATLVRAASYKQHIDLKNKDMLETGFEQTKAYIFEELAKEQPELYKQLASFINKKKDEVGA